MGQVKDIVEGFYSLFLLKIGFLKTQKRIIGLLRLQVCGGCEVRTVKFGVAVCDAKKGGCGCVLAAKSLSQSDCPFGFWGRETLLEFVP